MSSSPPTHQEHLIYHEPSPQDGHPPPVPPPPPPLPRRNPETSLSLVSPLTNEHSIVYGQHGQYPHLNINIPAATSNGYSSLDSRQSKPAPVRRRTSLPLARVVSHELNIARLTPQSEVESLVIETQEYVRDIKKRRNNIHTTLLRERAPGERLRRLLGYRIEQRLVKVLSTRKSRTNTRRKKKWPPYRRRGPQTSLKSKFSPSRMLRRISSKFTPKRRTNSQMRSYFLDFDKNEDCDCSDRSPTPRFLVDRQGEIRWPPFKISDGDNDIDNEEDNNNRNENFTLKNPQTTDSSSPDAPCVLGWLQVNSDSHIFTPALADSKTGPFRKAPFHSNMHVLQTKI